MVKEIYSNPIIVIANAVGYGASKLILGTESPANQSLPRRLRLKESDINGGSPPRGNKAPSIDGTLNSPNILEPRKRINAITDKPTIIL
ncbi:hypothetical protein NBRC116585_26000 [Thalassolituus maritimus]|uniref:Uncharacterized protein n=1 Tax=Thalassolituus maritimus TaxID=484498 RepID=A0ABQ0A2E5_9GAMM